MPLKEPRQNVKFALFALSGNQCAFPGCDALMFEDGSIVGEICHIHGQRPGSARYRSDLSDEEVHGIGNLVLMCKKHHKIVDDSEHSYSPDWLRRVKDEHESRATVTPTTVLHRLIEVLAPSVPDDWRDRPGAPIFRLNLASSRPGHGSWTYHIGAAQKDGGNVGGLRYRYSIGGQDVDAGRAHLLESRKWTLTDLVFAPRDEALEIELSFWWDGGERSVRWRWEKEAYFQGSEWDETYR